VYEAFFLCWRAISHSASAKLCKGNLLVKPRVNIHSETRVEMTIPRVVTAADVRSPRIQDCCIPECANYRDEERREVFHPTMPE
jgi:hypothetical protein